MTDEQSPSMLDIAGPTVVQVEISHDGKTLWVSVDGMCKLRASNVKKGILIEDSRAFHP